MRRDKMKAAIKLKKNWVTFKYSYTPTLLDVVWVNTDLIESVRVTYFEGKNGGFIITQTNSGKNKYEFEDVDMLDEALYAITADLPRQEAI